MANVDLGTFSFDAQAVDDQLSKLRNQMALLRDEKKKYTDQEKDYNKVIDATIKTQEELIAQGKEESAEMKVANKLLADLRKERQAVFNKNKELSEQQKKLNTEYREASKLINSLTDAEGNRVTSVEAINVALNKEVKSIADARASNKELLALRNQLDIADENNADSLAELNAALDKNNAFIKENVSAYEQQKIGIGDYQTAIENALGGTKLFGVSLGDVKSQLQNFAPVLKTIQGELTSIKTSFQTATQSTQGFSAAQKAMAVTTAATSGALKLLRVALIATGIGAIVVVLGSLIAFLASTQKGIDLVTSVTRPLSAVFGTLVGILQEVGEFLFEAFSNPQKTIKEVYDFVKNNVIAQFKAFAKILEGIFTMDFGLLKEGFSDLADNAKKNFDIVAGAVGKVAERMQEAYARGQEVDRLMKQLSRSEADFITNQAQLKENLKQQNLIAEDQTKTLAEREAAAVKSIQIAKEVNALQRDRLEIERQILELNTQNNDTSDAEKAEVAKKIAEINEANAQLLEIETTQQNKLNGIRKEAAAKALENLKKQQDDAIKLNQEALDLFIAEQGFRKKSSEEQLEIARETRDREIEILKQELEFKKITREKYLAEVLNIQNEYLQTERDLVIENAEIERDLLLANIEQRKTDYAAFTEEKLQIDIAASQDRLLAEQEFAELQLEQGIINQEEFDNQIFELKEEARLREQEAQLAYEEANKERLLIDEENRRILAEQKYTDEFELKKFQLEQQRLAEVAAAEKTGADVTLINAKYAKQQEDIERIKNENKVQLASDAFGNLASILGKETAAGKAAAIAQTTIDTYSSATKAFNSLANIPIVGTVLGALAAAAAVAAGLSNVKKIVSTPKPQIPTKAERGMRVPKWGTLLKGRSHKQGGIPIEAEGGEAIINKRSTAMFPGLLSMINVAGGGIPLAARGAVVGNVASRNANIQSRLLNDVNNNAMAESVANAVREGAMEGSMVGSQQGSQSGLIGLSENREVQRNSAF